ncbi:hypothetical protein BHE74_00027851 [Ensete ventricosum]|nr:hypothetical protein BHE74_00027851 [Ensete ventricosum]
MGRVGTPYGSVHPATAMATAGAGRTPPPSLVFFYKRRNRSSGAKGPRSGWWSRPCGRCTEAADVLHTQRSGGSGWNAAYSLHVSVRRNPAMERASPSHVLGQGLDEDRRTATVPTFLLFY